MSALPTGTVTFLLTDVEGSTAAWERDPEGTGKAIAALDRLMAQVVAENSGVLVKARGEGDSHFCVFAAATDAVAAGVEIQRSLKGAELQVRMAVHTGEVDLREGDYYGRTVNRAARLRAAGHGGQILVSEVAAALIREDLSDGLALRDLGSHRLKDLSSPESIYEVVVPGLREVTRPLATLDIRRNNLPLQLTPLIGREDTVDEVLELLAHRRLVSVVALGGTGKTRLALQVAADASGRHPGGVWYAELAPLHDPEHVPPAILAALGAATDKDDALTEAVDWIAEREVLLVLDNCEHLIDPVAAAVSHLLAKCPGLQVLTTSRQPLEVAGEAVFRLTPLGLPTPDDEISLIAEAPAVRLFLERGRAANPNLELTPANAPVIAKLCAGLDGLPLAIELAASRLKVLEPQQILERFSNRLALLDGGGAPTANRTVRAAIEWSHDLLKPDERRLFRRLALFEGSVSFETIEAVCGGSLQDPAFALGNLVDHSLVTADTTATSRRYRLLDLVRAYALELLDDSGERADLERVRADWFVDRASAIGESQNRGGNADFLSSQADVEAALEWRREFDPTAFAPSVLAIAAVWRDAGRWTLGARWVAAALEPGVTAESKDRLELLLKGASLAFSRWEFRDGTRLGEEALGLSRQLGDLRSEESAHNEIASSTWMAGDLDRARHHNEQALDLARLRDDGTHSAEISANNLGLVAMSRHDYESAEAWFQLCLDLGSQLGRRGHGLWRLGQVAEARGDREAAVRFLESALGESQCGEEWGGTARVERSLGRLLEIDGELEAAEAHFRRCHEAASADGKSVLSSTGLLDAARVAGRRGRSEDAEVMIGKAFAELADEPSSQIIVVDESIDLACFYRQFDLAYDLSDRLLEVTRRDGTAKGVAWATYLKARSAVDVNRREEARGLAVQARVRFVALGDVDVGRSSASERIRECDELLAEIEMRSSHA